MPRHQVHLVTLLAVVVACLGGPLPRVTIFDEMLDPKVSHSCDPVNRFVVETRVVNKTCSVDASTLENNDPDFYLCYAVLDAMGKVCQAGSMGTESQELREMKNVPEALQNETAAFEERLRENNACPELGENVVNVHEKAEIHVAKLVKVLKHMGCKQVCMMFNEKVRPLCVVLHMMYRFINTANTTLPSMKKVSMHELNAKAEQPVKKKPDKVMQKNNKKMAEVSLPADKKLPAPPKVPEKTVAEKVIPKKTKAKIPEDQTVDNRKVVPGRYPVTNPELKVDEGQTDNSPKSILEAYPATNPEVNPPPKTEKPKTQPQHLNDNVAGEAENTGDVPLTAEKEENEENDNKKVKEAQIQNVVKPVKTIIPSNSNNAQEIAGQDESVLDNKLQEDNMPDPVGNGVPFVPNDDDDDDVMDKNSQNQLYQSGEVDADSSHIFLYFTMMSLGCVVLYIMYLSKQKILATFAKLRRSRNRSRRRPSTASYRKLDCTLEEAVTSQCNANVTHVIY